MSIKIPRGPLAIGVEELSLNADDHRRLNHPLVGGVILFTRNFKDAEQLTDLTHAIKKIRSPELLISVDHEGGRVQRFRGNGFTELPALETFGTQYNQDPKLALKSATESAHTMAQELIQCGVDFSFAPVVDLHNPKSRVIADRAFHQNPNVICELATAYMSGMRKAGMKNVIKHFPGHGTVEADTHKEVAVDERDLTTLYNEDLLPFQKLIKTQQVDSVLASHVLYPKVDDKIVTFSKIWLTDILRDQLNFQGMIFSDDFGMHALTYQVSSTTKAIQKFFQAGGDVALLCNDFKAIDQALNDLEHTQLKTNLAQKWQALETQ